MTNASASDPPSYVPSIPLIPKTHTTQHSPLVSDSSFSVFDSTTDGLTSSVLSVPTFVNVGSAGPAIVIELPFSPTASLVVPHTEASPVMPTLSTKHFLLQRNSLFLTPCKLEPNRVSSNQNHLLLLS